MHVASLPQAKCCFGAVKTGIGPPPRGAARARPSRCGPCVAVRFCGRWGKPLRWNLYGLGPSWTSTRVGLLLRRGRCGEGHIAGQVCLGDPSACRDLPPPRMPPCVGATRIGESATSHSGCIGVWTGASRSTTRLAPYTGLHRGIGVGGPGGRHTLIGPCQPGGSAAALQFEGLPRNRAPQRAPRRHHSVALAPASFVVARRPLDLERTHPRLGRF